MKDKPKPVAPRPDKGWQSIGALAAALVRKSVEPDDSEKPEAPECRK